MLKYILGSLIIVPLLPILYWHGRQIRNRIPKLPEAEGTEGICYHESKKSLRIIYLGESTIAGVGVKTHEEGFAGTLSSLLSNATSSTIYWKVYAKSGYTMETLITKLIPAISEQNVNLIIIGMGGNDAFQLTAPYTWRRNSIELITKLQQKFKNTPIVFLNMPPIKEFPAFTSLIKFSIGNLVEILGQELKTVIKHFNQVHYASEKIEFKNWIKRFPDVNNKSDFFSDGVHPSKITYQLWASSICDYVMKSKLL